MIDGIYKPRVSNIEDLDNPTILQTLKAMKQYVVDHAIPGEPGAAATVQVGQVTTLPAGSQATVTNSGTNQAAVLNFGIPTGAPGANGAAATVQVGQVTTGAAGTQASVTNSGTTSAAVLDFTIPQGADGASGVTNVTTGTSTEQDGYTVTPITFNFEQGNSKTVEVKAKNGAAGGGGGGLQSQSISVSSGDTLDAFMSMLEEIGQSHDIVVINTSSNSPAMITFTLSGVNYTQLVSHISYLMYHTVILSGTCITDTTTKYSDTLTSVGDNNVVSYPYIAGIAPSDIKECTPTWSAQANFTVYYI